ncbi:hypothetical protein LTS15_004952 [Exophiala xenobiotica]|nr:hypothetical protein LTS15_004952 [Exophiala xenobiotica]
MARKSFYFGVEIELVAEPHAVLPQSNRKSYYKLYYEKLAACLRRHDIDAVADSLAGGYRKHSEHYDKWFITKDGSLGIPTDDAIPLEAVSRVCDTAYNWEDEIDFFWTSWGEVFKLPRRSAKCGSHIHVSPGPDKCFTLMELKKIACGIIYYADNLTDMLPQSRRNNQYCQMNWEVLGIGWGNCDSEDMRQAMKTIWEIDDKGRLKNFMQDDRYVLWNFEHVAPTDTCNSCSGTVEFRGGRGLRGPNRTKWWIAFVLSFIQLCISIESFPNVNTVNRPSTDSFWRLIQKYARTIQVAAFLPPDWHHLNESYKERERETLLTSPCRSGQSEDAEDSFSDESETSSIVSKGASESSRSPTPELAYSLAAVLRDLDLEPYSSPTPSPPPGCVRWGESSL